jgi:hypothetical protein
MIQELLRDIEGLGCAVTVEQGNLKLHDPRPVTEVQKGQLRTYKREVLGLFEQQDLARSSGWLVYSYGGIYEKRIGRNSAVYIIKEEDSTYTVWRGTWKEKETVNTEKVVIAAVDFKEAFEKANNYVNWFFKKTKRTG